MKVDREKFHNSMGLFSACFLCFHFTLVWSLSGGQEYQWLLILESLVVLLAFAETFHWWRRTA